MYFVYILLLLYYILCTVGNQSGGVLRPAPCPVTTLFTGENQSVGVIRPAPCPVTTPCTIENQSGVDKACSLSPCPMTTLCTGGNQSGGVLRPAPGLCQHPAMLGSHLQRLYILQNCVLAYVYAQEPVT